MSEQSSEFNKSKKSPEENALDEQVKSFLTRTEDQNIWPKFCQGIELENESEFLEKIGVAIPILEIAKVHLVYAQRETQYPELKMNEYISIESDYLSVLSRIKRFLNNRENKNFLEIFEKKIETENEFINISQFPAEELRNRMEEVSNYIESEIRNPLLATETDNYEFISREFGSMMDKLNKSITDLDELKITPIDEKKLNIISNRITMVQNQINKVNKKISNQDSKLN